MPNARDFFFKHAGWSYDPAKQSEFVGRTLGAMQLAAAEAWAKANDAVYEWQEDDRPADLQHEDGTWYQLPAVCCVLLMPCEDCKGGDIAHCSRKKWYHVRESLSGITESDDRQEARDYRRVVEAELALQAMP